ncbi:MAG: PAS domain S-box protein [Prolixibacteraceae bacterium]|nr:PAS domain S-box protein [Prolixibacteraceae bacterium]
MWTEVMVYPIAGRDRNSTTLLGVTRDITERKRAEEALRHSEEKFRALYANMIDGSALHTLVFNEQGIPVDYLINEVNPAFETLLGISRESVINKTSREAYGVDVPPYFEVYSKVALTGNPEVFETYFAPLDKYFSISVYCPYKNSFATIFENITERKKAEQNLKIVLAKYQVLFEIFPIGITVSDAAGKIIESNQIAETLLGISLEEQEKRKIDGLEWRIIRSDGTTMPVSEYASVRALEEGRPLINVEMGIVKGKNHVTWLNVSATPIPIEGYGVAIVYGDITKRKQAENENLRTQRLLEDSQRIGKVGGWEINMDTMELKWTQEMYNIHEVDLTFKPKVDQRVNFYTPESLLVIDKAFQDAVAQGGSYEVNSEIITAKGNHRIVKSIAKVDLDNRRVFGLFQDITDQKQVEAELKIKNEQLRELNATKDKFFSIIAHDLKAPFSGILGFSEILRDEARNLDIGLIESYANNINSTAHQTFKLLENLLDWAKMQQNGFSFKPRSISFNYILKTEIESLIYIAEQKNITLVNTTVKEIIFAADEKMLSSVLRNLISNAIKFTHKGGKVSIEAEIKVDQIEISISDTGIGMDKETLQKLFKIEDSFTSRGTENEKGTGLGLLLCKEFVEKNGGKIWVDSEKGKGSTFTFSIPLVPQIQ